MTDQQASFDDMLDQPDWLPSIEEPVEAENTGATMTNALATYSSAPMMAADDIFIPRVRLTQGLTKEVQAGTARPGQFIMTGFDAASEIVVVPLMFTRRRELTDEEFTVLCKSDDGQHGVGVPGGTCSACQMNKWTDTIGGKRQPPDCTFIYSYIVYVVEWATLGILEFKRTSIGAGKSLNTMVAQRGLGKFAVTLTGESAAGKRGSYHTILVKPAKVDQTVIADAIRMMSA